MLYQFVESECEVLPSKERCPYLVVAELIEQPFSSKSEEIYTQGTVLCSHIVLCHARLSVRLSVHQSHNSTLPPNLLLIPSLS